MSITLNAKVDDDSDNGGYVVGLAQHWEEADHIKEMCYNAMLGFSIQ